MASLYVKGGNFLNLDILNIYTGKEFHSTTYTYAFKPNIIWGTQSYDHLTMADYQQFQTDFKKLVKFSLEDLSLFTAFNNMAFDGSNPNNRKLMLWYLWQHCIKDVFKELGGKLGLDLDLDLEDLTNIGLNTKLPYSSVKNL